MSISNYRYNQDGSTHSYMENGKTYYTQGASGASGASGTSGAYGASGVSGASGAYGASGVSGASGVTVKDLTFEQVKSAFEKGNLVFSELKAWINAHKSQVTNVNYSTLNNFETANFTYQGVKYTIKCNKTASASQIDDKSNVLYAPNSLTI